MLKLKYSFIAVLVSVSITSLAQVDFEKADKSNTWLKIGVNTALPIADLGQTHKVGLGLDASIQFLETKASGIGAKVGYIKYFAKDANKDIAVIPLAIMYRYYPESAGWFAGLELGYAFTSELAGTSGGFFGRPQVGLHYDFWNFFAYYDKIVIEEAGVKDLDAIGLGITYNVRFK